MYPKIVQTDVQVFLPVHCSMNIYSNDKDIPVMLNSFLILVAWGPDILILLAWSLSEHQIHRSEMKISYSECSKNFKFN